MAGLRSVGAAADAGKKVTAFGGQSALRYRPDGTAIVEQPRATAPGTSYADEVFKQLFDVKSPKRAQKSRKLDRKSGKYVAADSQEVLRNRPDFILQAMLDADPNTRALIKESWDKASPEQKEILAQEIAETFPDAQRQSPGGSPMYREIMSFLRTGELSPERMQVLRQEADLANSDPRVRRDVQDLPPGHPDRAAVTEDMDDLDQEVRFEPDSKVPGDPLLDAGPRAFPPPEGVDTTNLRTELEYRPYLRGNETASVRGDKINPKKERFDTNLVEGTVEPTPEEIAAHRTSWMRSKVAEIAPDHPRLSELTPEFMEQLLTSRGIAIEPGEPPSRRQMPVRLPQPGGTVGPQDAGRVFAGEGYEKADAARIADMERALSEEFGMDIDDVREQIRRVQESGDRDAIREMKARIDGAFRNADLGRRPEKPYDSIGRQSDIRAASSVAEGGEQRMLADALDQLGRGQLGAEDRVFRMLLNKAARESVGTPSQAGIPNAEAMADYALSLIRNPEVLGRIAANKGFETWRQQIISALDNRFYRQDTPPRVLTREEAAKIDAEIDAHAGDPDAEWGITEVRPNAVTDEQMADYQARREQFERATGRGSGYMATVLSDVLEPRGGRSVSIDAGTPFMPTPAAPMVPPPATPMAPGGNVGRLGEPQGLRQSQAADAYPQGIDQYGRPVSAIEGRSPTAGRKSPGHVNSPVDRYPGSEGVENLSQAAENIGARGIAGVPISPEDGEGVLSVQAQALENSIGYANQRGKVVWQDPDTGDILAAYITPKMSPERVAAIRESAREFGPSTGEVFDYYWPEGGLPRPDFHRWNLGDAADEVPEGYVPPSAAPARDMGPVEPMPPATPKLYSDVPPATLKEAEGKVQAAQAALTEDGPLPPGISRGLDGRLYRSAFYDKPGLFADNADPNSMLDEASDIADGMPAQAAAPSPNSLDEQTAGAWEQAGRTVLDADGNEIPLAAASAEDLANAVASIVNNPDASAEDIEFARQVYRGLRDAYNDLPDERIKAEYKAYVIDPVENAAANRRASAARKPLQEPAPEVGDPDAPAIDPATASVADDVQQNLDAAATEVGDEVPAQPSAASADNAKPQEPPKQVEDAARQQANAQKQASDAEAEKADAKSQADAAAREATEANQAAQESAGTSPDPKKTTWQRTKEHVGRNWGKYGLGAAATGVGLSVYQSSATSDPYPDSLPPLGLPPGEAAAAAVSPEDRIRMMMRSRGGSEAGDNPYPRQTLWRVY